MSTDEKRRERRFHLWGWGLFVASACFFIAASARAGDALGLAGAILFFIACFVFLVPLIVRGEKER